MLFFRQICWLVQCCLKYFSPKRAGLFFLLDLLQFLLQDVPNMKQEMCAVPSPHLWSFCSNIKGLDSCVLPQQENEVIVLKIDQAVAENSSLPAPASPSLIYPGDFCRGFQNHRLVFRSLDMPASGAHVRLPLYVQQTRTYFVSNCSLCCQKGCGLLSGWLFFVALPYPSS